ncbi:Peptidoglycan-binding domain 1 protein [Cellulomonas flavigena DSM 20109]|uniref:Peptidoglycan-binding domain 1 protein n=1 Tax=Cellulomonas flavigena (strain ATCC 482 / DSM 20109 / BCRC 11376 / JCM 18109 / NBRC 3775 / NCIMB 8073 / NRS 134) TaxID=446466 RepID=D5UE87_CELFN|nr:peptidoglycan-binding domain-containing protein [Cellulomonas flavigena]ADG76563.1 Peptidoglycan-binding domain 1 protein [Cellulomonas flavigena DSM 20109]
MQLARTFGSRTRNRLVATAVATALLLVGAAASPAAAWDRVGGNCNYMEEQFSHTYRLLIPRATNGVVNVPCWLKRGDSGAGVQALQKAYNSCYKALYEPAIAEDGVFGPTTEDRVRQMQRREGIEVDGIAGEVTRNSIKWPLYSATTGKYLRCWDKW